MKIKVSAPGKLMFFGEHAVVYGYPCIVTAVDKRLYLEVEKISKKKDEITTPQVKENNFVSLSLKNFKQKFGVQQSVKITTKGDFSHNVGLGSSSAATVATFKALSLLFGIPLNNRQIFDLSYRVNLEIQGVGSGFDIAAATYGGMLYFETGGKQIAPLVTDSLPLVVGYSGIKADTPKIVKSLKLKVKSQKTKYHKIFNQIGRLVNEAKNNFVGKNWKKLGELMDKNHKLLQELGVSTPKLDQMVAVAVNAGAWGAKLSGAGGGDCMIALVSKAKKTFVEKAIRNTGGEIIKVNGNTQGVMLQH